MISIVPCRRRSKARQHDVALDCAAGLEEGNRRKENSPRQVGGVDAAVVLMVERTSAGIRRETTRLSTMPTQALRGPVSLSDLDIATMTDREIVDVFNGILAAQERLLAAWDKTVTEEPPGEKQIDYDEDRGQWSRAATCSAASSTTAALREKSRYISTTRNCHSRNSVGCSRLNPKVEIRKPKRRKR